MAAEFVSASGQRLSSAAPLTAPPFTVGAWVFPTTVAAGVAVIYSLSNSTLASNWLAISRNGAAFRITAQDGTATNTAFGTATANAWHFIVGRFAAATNRKAAVLHPDGSTAFGSSVTSRTPTGIDVAGIGARNNGSIVELWDGSIGELWVAKADIQPDGAQLLDSTLRQLAYGGPFSVPDIAKDIIEYRSFRKHPASDGDEIGEVHHGALGRQVWTNTNGVTIGHHPPLPYWYEKPGQRRVPLIV